ncbi:Crp/Fnr family transcriptional regulator [Acuticoccus sp. M5D2P5]|uniref:Crp/Fnr family transcriptional regulator n=1 Tax=Acuticoccus kalidii TaxID=2910977 RepID=UPI001F2FDAF7|nr:Crp/Fnr family transcriptional regulator [Acuticoccus kalidii]MCF3931916.1 Crp/Fnr family transcriptional regulator [Acuticoccus kalidii]
MTDETIFPLTARMTGLGALDHFSQSEIQTMHGRQEQYRAGSEVVLQGRLGARPWVVVSGWLMRTHVLKDGRRQILGYLLPGDLLNFTLHSAVSNFCDIECVTDVVLADISTLREHIASADDDDPIVNAFWTMLAHDDAMALNAVARLTRQSAYERLAHLFLDLHDRLALAQQAGPDHFEMPLTQQALGDALGVSVVHVNRVFMKLRREGFIDRVKQTLILPDIERLSNRVDHSVPKFTPGAKHSIPFRPSMQAMPMH